ncbi:hypothetical protein BGZ57DRAFT_1006861, partial [Hyaloscypha finlandica]
MRSSFASSRDSRDAKGRKLKLSQRGDPEKRPILTRIYGMVGCLIVSLALIALLIVLQKKLPSGAASDFHIPVRRDVETSVLERQEHVRKEKMRIPAAPIQPRGRFAPPLTFAPTPTIAPIVERQGRFGGSVPIGNLTGIHFATPFPTPTGTTCINGTSMDIECTVIPIIFEKAKRQDLTPDTSCYTTVLGDCPTTSTITVNSCSVILEQCTFTETNVDLGPQQVCSNSTITEPSCTLSTSTPTPTPPSVTIIPVNSCVSILEECSYTVLNVDIGPQQVCSNSTITQSECILTTSTPTPAVSNNSCMATSTSCTTTGDVDRGIGTSCATLSSSIPGCGITTNSCMATSTSCITVGDVDKGFETSCGTTSTSIPGCGITTTPSPTVSSNSCMSTSTSCTTVGDFS